jgi:hypothetical protein
LIASACTPWCMDRDRGLRSWSSYAKLEPAEEQVAQPGNTLEQEGDRAGAIEHTQGRKDKEEMP